MAENYQILSCMEVVEVHRKLMETQRIRLVSHTDGRSQGEKGLKNKN
jgi:hypothetical protein